MGFIFVYHALVYKGQVEEIESLEARLYRVERHVERVKLRIERENIEDLKAELTALENQLDVLERLLPKAEEVPDLLEMIERKGIQAGINAILFEPKGFQDSNQYREQIYKVSVRGGYHSIGTFLSRVGSSPRIVKASNMILVAHTKKEGDRDLRSVVANFEISTFILPGRGGGEVVTGNESNG